MNRKEYRMPAPVKDKEKTAHKTKYAMLKGYGTLAIPMDLLEEIARRSYIVNTTYADSQEVLSSVEDVTNVQLIDHADIEACKVQMRLEGK